MQTSQGNMLASLRNVQAFLEENADQLSSVINTGARQSLDNAIIDLSTHASTQTGSNLESQGATLKKNALREVLLRDHMAPISRIGRADLPHTPELEPLKMPAGRPTAERLAAAATGMAHAAEPFAAVFIAAGLPTDFIAQLTAASDAMLKSLDVRMQSRGRRAGATSGLKDKLIAGRKIVHILDAFVQSALKDNAALLANWNVVKRVQKVTGRAAASAPAPATPATPATPTASPTTTAA